MNVFHRLTVVVLLGVCAPAAQADYAKGSAALEKRDFAVAGAEFEAAAKAGDARAMAALAGMFEAGLGVERDAARAFDWYSRAAEAGHVRAQGALARLYSTGQGTARDDRKAFEWARRAADKGDMESQFIMGIRYAEGRGVKADHGQAILWLGAAAEQGMGEAQMRLAHLLVRDAALVKSNPVQAQWMRGEAYKWLAIARRGGVAEAVRAQEIVGRTMTAGQIEAAEKEAEKFRPVRPSEAAAARG